jgi:hypothetical protein
VEVTEPTFATREERMRWLLDEIGAYLYSADTCAECRSTLNKTIRDASINGPLRDHDRRALAALIEMSEGIQRQWAAEGRDPVWGTLPDETKTGALR